MKLQEVVHGFRQGVCLPQPVECVLRFLNLRLRQFCHDISQANVLVLGIDNLKVGKVLRLFLGLELAQLLAALLVFIAHAPG
ncbi:hypothetical protein G0Q06_02165 [Puniceicoccales bacterium CK1056]|uniref:Uncharacterized protein n=1 Tax=Oceanipulchritudo coccoides TaxID=2706888 RepID=A0A6B2LXF2_9BACT|nr:hypothetical protein [Oceanipulchritudo coccoides]NDV61251.1 hypothetical protein [Oceanipulchritudo coccoides]